MVERGEVEAIVMTASGCGVTVREYLTFCTTTRPITRRQKRSRRLRWM
jgi:hypothetical protein